MFYSLNNGNGTFSEISRLAGVHATDWSWGALIFDMDNDGLKDIFVANGIYKELLNQDYINFASNPELWRIFDKEKGNYFAANRFNPFHTISKLFISKTPETFLLSIHLPHGVLVNRPIQMVPRTVTWIMTVTWIWC